MSVPAPDRTQLRREIRAVRRAMSARERASRSQALVKNLSRSHLLWSAQRIVCFWPNDGEVDLRSLFTALWRCNKQVLLPVIDGVSLWFAPYTATCKLRENQFGIPEPVFKRDQACSTVAIDLVLMPLVAFDQQGNRLGMGGGYYDRTFAYLRHRKRLLRPHLIGTAYSFQEQECLPLRAWDVPLNGIVTDKAYIVASR